MTAPRHSTGEDPIPVTRPECHHHVLTQHRDARPPWCVSCGRTADGRLAELIKPRVAQGRKPEPPVQTRGPWRAGR